MLADFFLDLRTVSFPKTIFILMCTQKVVGRLRGKMGRGRGIEGRREEEGDEDEIVLYHEYWTPDRYTILITMAA